MKHITCLILLVLVSFLPIKSTAQIPIIEVIKKAAVKVIKAVDLKIQRLQNETIWLQNAQKVLENTLSKLKLQEIGDWVDKQRQLYDDYFQELSKVKTIISGYHRVKEMMQQQAMIVKEYRAAYALFQRDTHFTPAEIDYMRLVYEGILKESLQNLDQLQLVVNAFATQMTDAERLIIINDAANRIDNNYRALQRFNNQNKLLSVQRSKNIDEARMIRAMYGL